MLTRSVAFRAYRTPATVDQCKQQVTLIGSFFTAGILPALSTKGEPDSCSIQLQEVGTDLDYNKIEANMYIHEERDHTSIKVQYLGSQSFGIYMIGGRYIGSFLIALGIYMLLTNWSTDTLRDTSPNGWFGWTVFGLVAFAAGSNRNREDLYPSDLSQMIEEQILEPLAAEHVAWNPGFFEKFGFIK